VKVPTGGESAPVDAAREPHRTFLPGGQLVGPTRCESWADGQSPDGRGRRMRWRRRGPTRWPSGAGRQVLFRRPGPVGSRPAPR